MSSWSDDGVVVKDEDGEIVVIGNATNNSQQMLSLAYKLSLLQGFPIGGKPPVIMRQNDN